MVLNVSVSLAVYALMALYHAFQAELAPHRPLAQILCIKVRTKRMQHIRTSTRLMPRMCGYCVASQGVVFFAFCPSVSWLCTTRNWSNGSFFGKERMDSDSDWRKTSLVLN